MRTRLSTRAALLGLGLATLLALRAAPTGSDHRRARLSTLPEAAAAVPVQASDVSYPLDREDQPDVSRSAPETPQLIWPAPGPITSPCGAARHLAAPITVQRGRPPVRARSQEALREVGRPSEDRRPWR